MSAHQVILASAGTGKTFRLSGRFIERLFDDVPPERVLATTFTRKAAAEILERVLRRLALAVDDAEERALLLGEGDTPPDREAVVARLAGLARRIDRFDVRTLDSFFVELVRVFAMDLGLPAGWRISDPVDEERMRAEAIGRVLDEVSAAELIELLRALQKNQARRSVHAALMDIVREAHAAWRDSPPGAWEALQPPDAPDDAVLAEAIETAGSLDPLLTQKDEPHKSWVKGRTTSLDAARDGEWRRFAKSGFVQRALDGRDYYGEPIDDDHRAALAPLVTRAAHEILTGVLHHSRHMRALLARYDRVFVELQRERRAYRFEDFPRALLEADWHGAQGAYRRDGVIDHLLLDEFQDTSALQWRVLRPLADAIFSDSRGERSLFCVGDLKQSIYGWRAGEPRLLSGLADAHPESVDRLDDSYRSGQVVLDAVNKVFGDIAANDVLAADPVLSGAAATWHKGFAPHKAVKTSLPSAARLLEVPATGDGSRERAVEVVRAAAKHVASLHREAPHASIGVLFRRKQDLPLMLRALRDAGVMASGEGGNPVTDSALVNVVLSLLWLADHPADSAARYHVATSALAGAAPDEWIGLAPDDGVEVARESAARWRARLLRDGYGPSLAALRPFVRAAHAHDTWEQERFGQLVDLAYAWDARATGRPADFVELVRATSVEDPRAAPVKVITVHRAKGLEFDAVVLPDLDAQLIGRPGDLFTERPDPNEPYSLVCPSVPRDLLLVDENLARVGHGVRGRALQEELCVLYVAMTRAKRRLDMLVSAKGRNSRAQSFAMILRDALVSDGEEAGSGTLGDLRVLWAHDDNAADWAPVTQEQAAAAGTTAAEDAPIVLQPSRRARLRPRRSPSSRDGAGTVLARELLARHEGRGAARGLVIHGWLAAIEWLEDGLPDEAKLGAIAREVSQRDALGVTDEEIDRWRDDLRAMLERDAVVSVLGREAQDLPQDPEVWRERRFAVVASDADCVETLMQGAFDRVLVGMAGDRVVSADIVDYKTDRVDAQGGLDALVAKYTPQMQRYRAAMAALTGLPADEVRCRLLFLEADALREV